MNACRRLAQLFDGVEAADPEEVLLQRPDEPLGAAVALGLAHEGGRRRDAEEGELALEVVGDELAAVVVAQLEARSDALGEGAEAGADTLPDRLEGLEAGGSARGVDADALGRAMVDGDEDRGLPLGGQGRGQIAAPHRVDPLGSDRAVVRLWAVRAADPAWRLQAVLSGQPQDPALGGADAGEAEPGPDLPVAFAMERSSGEQVADHVDQLIVRHRSDRARSPGLSQPALR